MPSREQVSITDITEGMTTAKDVYSSDGTLLIPANTTLKDFHIVKINLYDIPYIDIFHLEEDNLSISDPKTPIIEPITETAAFMEFSSNYFRHVQDVEAHLSHIVINGDVDPESLIHLSSTVIDQATSQRDLFNYMCHLQSTDDVTFAHSMNVSLFASILGRWLHYNETQIKELAVAGLLHDIGKICVNQDILNKREPLTHNEFKHLKQHTILGYELIKDAALPESIKYAVLMHHEKLNGGGYPLSIPWDKIHDYAKIISIVDIYDAMTSERPYHKRHHPFKVIRMFEEECYGVLDTHFLYVFLEHIAHNFLGTRVELSDGLIGHIIFIHPKTPSRPMVQLITGPIIDLSQKHHIEIQAFLP